MKLLRAITGVFFAACLSLCGASLLLAAPRDADGNEGSASISAAAHAGANGDALLEALLTELDRSKTQLRMDQVQPPYYIEYRVNDVDEYGAEATFGALREQQRIHVRILRVVVRVGDYKQDSYFGQGMGETNILPLDDDPIALRHQIWLATDAAYKAAGEALTEKQAALKQFSAEEQPVDDFSKAPVATTVEPTVNLRIDETSWQKTLEDVTNLYRRYPDVQSITASARFSAINEYLVSSEGTVARTGKYRGPVLFAPDAADDVVASMIGANVLGRKPQLGRPNRTTGAFGTSYKARVLPNFLSVVDDPIMKDFQGKSLVGSYDVDDEGVKAQPVTLIDSGTLTNYLLGRQPIRDFPTSNGHGRAAPGSFPAPSLGVLLLKSSEAESPDALKQRLVQIVSGQGKPYGYRVETMGGNAPRLLYRVYAKDGHEELVRGAVFNELDIRALRSDLIAAGNDPLVSNRAGGVPTTVISPSLLFGELEVKRADTSKDKLPDYPAPPLAQK